MEEHEASLKNNLENIKVELPKDFQDRHVEVFNTACKLILKQDPSLLNIIVANDSPLYLKTNSGERTLQDHFIKLASAVISQQISGSASKSIKKRFIELYDDVFPTYTRLYEDMKNPEKQKAIIGCGVSRRKVSYMESLATYFAENEEKIRELFQREDNDEEVIEDLVSNIKGIGPWTAKMFLITSLRRIDVFAPEDVGIARGCSRYLSDKPDLVKKLMSDRKAIKKSKIKHKKLKWKIYDEDIIELCAEQFTPYRSIFMFILWRLSSTDVNAMIKTEKDFVRG